MSVPPRCLSSNLRSSRSDSRAWNRSESCDPPRRRRSDTSPCRDRGRRYRNRARGTCVAACSGDSSLSVKARSYIARCPVFADLFIQTPSRLLWEAYSHAAITARRLFVHISTFFFKSIYLPHKKQKSKCIHISNVTLRCTRSDAHRSSLHVYANSTAQITR